MTNSIKKLQLSVDGDGRIGSLRWGECEFAALPDQQDGLFVLQFRDFIGTAYRVSQGDFDQIAVDGCNDGGWTIVCSQCRALRGVVVTMRISPSPDGSWRWGITAVPGRDSCQVEWIDYPRLPLRRDPAESFLIPFAEGTLIRDLPRREERGDFRVEYASYPLSGVGSCYPGPAAMQFAAVFHGSAGLYIGCEDESHAPKLMDFSTRGSDGRCSVCQCFTGGEESPGFEVVTRGFDGDWQSAAAIGRQWIERHDPFLPAAMTTQRLAWLAQSPVVVAFAVRGRGLDCAGMAPNDYFPYCRALPYLEEFRRRWHSPLLALLMHWEGTAPWAPPYIWPPYGGVELLKTFADRLHEHGDRIGLYASGIGWTQQSVLLPEYDRREQFESEHIADEICTGPHGEAWSKNCNGAQSIRLGYDLCPAREFTRQTVVGEIRSATAAGIDYLQYFDQNQGAAAPLCYSRHHGHPSLPGAWSTAAMRKLLASAVDAAGDTVMGCENAAAEPYMEFCRLNDNRSHLAWGAGGEPVPVYPFLFHQYCSGFAGNGVCLSEWIDTVRTPFFAQWTLAWNFVNGNLLSVVLKDNGKIHWNWGLSWDLPEPEQAPLHELLHNLCAWRQGEAAQFLAVGRMEELPAEIDCGSRVVFRRKLPPVTTPSVLAASWSAGGRHCIILANYGTGPEVCAVRFKAHASGQVARLEGASEGFAGVSHLELSVPPLNAMMILLE